MLWSLFIIVTSLGTAGAILLNLYPECTCNFTTKANPSKELKRSKRFVTKPFIEKFLVDFFNHHNIDFITLVLHASDQKNIYMPALAKEFNDESFKWNIKIVSKNPKSTIFGMTDVTDSKVKSALVLLSDLDKVANFIKMENLGFPISFNNANTFLLAMLQNSSRIRTSVSDMNLNLNLASNVYTASNSNNEITIHEVYLANRKLPPVIQKVGSFNSATGLVMTKTPFWERRQNLRGDHLKFTSIAANKVNQNFYIKVEHNKTMFYGRAYAIWNYFETTSNFTSEYIPVVDGLYGADTGNGSFNGMIGMVQRGDVDATVAAIAVSGTRANVTSPLFPIGSFRSRLYFKSSGGGLILNWLTYTKPFSIGIWILTAGGMLTGYCLFVLSAKKGKVIEEEHEFGNYCLSLMIVIYGLVNQGSPHEPVKMSSRIVFFTIFLTITVLWSCYSAVLTSSLTAQSELVPFVGLRGFMEKKDYKIVTLGGGYYEGLFKRGNPLQQEIYKSGRMYFVKKWEEAFEELATKPNVLAFGSTSRYDQLIGKSCDYKQIPGFSVDTLFSFYVAKNAPYRDLFNYHLQKLIETGLLEQFDEKWDTLPRKNCKSLDTKPLGLENTVSSFGFLVFTMMISLIVLSIEKLCRINNHLARKATQKPNIPREK